MLHDNNYVHFNLRPENIFIFEDKEKGTKIYKISDFHNCIKKNTT